MDRSIFSDLFGEKRGYRHQDDSLVLNSRAAKLGWDEGKINADRIGKVRRLVEVADKLNLKVGQLALAWILRQNNVSSALVGASRPEQVKENAGASGVKLDAAVIAEIEQILD